MADASQPDPTGETRDVPTAAPRPGSSRRARRWVNVLGLIALLLILLFAVLLLVGGGHGPARHAPSSAASDGLSARALGNEA